MECMFQHRVTETDVSFLKIKKITNIRSPARRAVPFVTALKIYCQDLELKRNCLSTKVIYV